MTSPVKILVINLRGSTERRDRMRRQLEALGLDFDFVDAVDGRGFDLATHPAYDGPRRRRAYGRDLSGGELGCLLSHRSIYEKMLAEGLEQVLVLEDDVILGADFLAVLPSILAASADCDVVRFLSARKIARLRQRRVAPLAGGYWLARLETTPGGAYAYLIRRRGAEKLLPFMQRNWLPVDTLMGRSWETGLRWLIVCPALADYDRDIDPDISFSRYDKGARRGGAGRLAYRLSRARFKLLETLGKRRVYWSAWAADRRGLKAARRERPDGALESRKSTTPFG
ncbi:MAG: glycosyltransferase family 25 protein [Kiloniellaceae bacterium]